MKQAAISFLLLLLIHSPLSAQIDKREYYEIRIYHLKGKAQEAVVDGYLKNAFLPTLHRVGVKNIGVFKPLEADTLNGKRIVVLIPFKKLDMYAKVQELIAVDAKYNADGKEYLDAVYSAPPYERMETILLRAFKGMPNMQPTPLKGNRADRVYELRSYESATEKIHVNKVKMFNDGDEVGLFKRLGFNAVFYAAVVTGSHMPNLMYMTTFDNQASRDEHWKAFTEDQQWKTLKAMPEYQNNVSKITIYFLRPTEYSDY